MSCRMVLPSVVLPQPLSPTSPSTSPRYTSISTPSTAFTKPTVRRKTPAFTGKCAFTPLRLRMTSSLAGDIDELLVAPAHDAMGRCHLGFGRHLIAGGDAVPAALRELAAGRAVERIGGRAGYRQDALVLAAAEDRDRVEQGTRIGVRRMAQHVLDGA